VSVNLDLACRWIETLQTRDSVPSQSAPSRLRPAPGKPRCCPVTELVCLEALRHRVETIQSTLGADPQRPTMVDEQTRDKVIAQTVDLPGRADTARIACSRSNGGAHVHKCQPRDCLHDRREAL